MILNLYIYDSKTDAILSVVYGYDIWIVYV